MSSDATTVQAAEQPRRGRGWRARPQARRALAGLALAACVTLGGPPASAREEIVIIHDLAPPAAPDTSARTPGGIRPPAPASGLSWTDTPDDAGRSVELAWKASPSDNGSGRLTHYALERAAEPGGPWTAVDSVPAGATAATDRSVRRDTDYFYRVTAVGPGGRTPALSVTGPVTARSEWMVAARWSVLVLIALFFGTVLVFILRAEEGRPGSLRRIAGIDAIEEAVGRAAGTGRPVLVIPGSGDIDEMQTVAGLVILGHVARLAASQDTPLVVPVSYPIPHALAEEMVRSGHAQAGRPEGYDPESVRFVSPEQFAYGAAVTGIIVRERPAAVLYLGSFFGESLMLAETGFASGAMQVAGTANVHQLPFFVAACDHTLIGEELFAASAYLSGDPRRIGSLQGADVMKVLVIVIILVGCALESAGIHGLTALLATR